jgi:hypothetical protein
MAIKLEDPHYDPEVLCLLERSAKLRRASSNLLADMDALCCQLKDLQEGCQKSIERSAEVLKDIVENRRAESRKST